MSLRARDAGTTSVPENPEDNAAIPRADIGAGRTLAVVAVQWALRMHGFGGPQGEPAVDVGYRPNEDITSNRPPHGQA